MAQLADLDVSRFMGGIEKSFRKTAGKIADKVLKEIKNELYSDISKMIEVDEKLEDAVETLIIQKVAEAQVRISEQVAEFAMDTAIMLEEHVRTDSAMREVRVVLVMPGEENAS